MMCRVQGISMLSGCCACSICELGVLNPQDCRAKHIGTHRLTEQERRQPSECM